MKQLKNIINPLRLFTVLILSAGLTACTNKDWETPEESNPRILKLNYQIDEKVEGQTYAVDAEAHECRMNEVYTLFFRASDHATAPNKYVGYTRTKISSSANSGTAQISLPPNEDINDKWQLLFLANFDDNAFLDGEANTNDLLKNKLTGKTFDEAQSYLMAYLERTTGLFSPLPMSASIIKEASTNIANITLKRRVARIDANNSAGNFVLETAQVWNARTKGYLFDKAGNHVNGDSDGDFANYNEQIANASGGILKAKLYAFPNFVATPTLQDHQTTCLIIGGKYNGSTVTTYYRLNVCAPGGQQTLKANSAYTLSITKVTGAGEEKPGDAYDRSELQMEYNLNEWDNSFLGTYVFDADGNGLAVSQRNVVFSNQGNQTVQLEVFTLNSPTHPITTGWSISDVTGTGAAYFTAVKGEENARKYIRVSVLSDNTTTIDRQAAVTVTWGNISIPVNLTQLNPTSISLFGGIKTNPTLLWFPAAGATKEICVNLQGNFSGITRTDIAASLFYDGTTTGWLALSKGTTPDNVIEGIYYYNVTALPTTGETRKADIKFTVTKGNLVATTQVEVDQTVTDQSDPGYMRLQSMYVYAKQTNGTYTERGLLADQFNTFQGIPAGHNGSNCLQFATVGCDFLKYQLRIQSSMAWKIVVSASTQVGLTFDKMSDTGDVTEKRVWITANKDVAVIWSGSFYVEYENGDRTNYVVYQEGIFATLPTNNQVYFYKTMMINGRMWLDRNLGATVGQNGLSGYFSNQGSTITHVTNVNEAKGVYLTRTQANTACPSGFRLPKITAGSGEWDWVLSNAKWSGAGAVLYGTTCTNVWYVTLSTDPEIRWLIPISGYGSSSGILYGYYWCHTTGYICFYNNTTCQWFVESDLGFPTRCIRDN